MKLHQPRRSILYQSVRRFLLTVGAIQCGLLFAGFLFDKNFDFMPWFRWNILLFAVVFLVCLWVVEWSFFFAKKARLSTDEHGFKFEHGDVHADADWSLVELIQLRRWEMHICLADKVLSMPLVPPDEQREIYRLWFKVRGLSPSKNAHIKSSR